MPHMLNLVTDFGEMDLTFTPAGSTGDFDGWRRGATPEEIEDGLTGESRGPLGWDEDA